MIRNTGFILAATVAALAAPQLQAATIFWQGGSNTLTSVNYVTNPPGALVAPAPADIVNFGSAGTATHAVAGTTSFTRLRVGHNQVALNGTGTVTINNGNVSITNNVIGTPALMVGQQRNGTLNINGAGSSVTVARLINVGNGTDTNRVGTVNITNGGSLTATLGNIVLGETGGTAAEGNQGHMFVNGNVTIAEGAADLLIGPAGAAASFTQTGGTVLIGDSVEVGPGSGTNNSSLFTISGGALTTGTGGTGNFFVGRGTTNATANISGSAIMNVGNRYLMGANATTGSVTNHSGGTVNSDLDFRIADAFTSATSDATYNLSGTGVINTNTAPLPADPLTTSTIIGRRGTGRFFQTGGTANFNSPLFIGNREAAGPTVAANGLYEISDGDLNVNAASPTWPLAMSIAANGTGEFRVVGDDATIDVTGDFAISTTINGAGTLAFELEAGDILSMINVAGTATFNAGSVLLADASNAPFTQFHYDVLTATNIVDGGISFSAPAGWSYRIIDGGNGKILRIIVPEPGAVGLVLMAVAMVQRRRRT